MCTVHRHTALHEHDLQGHMVLPARDHYHDGMFLESESVSASLHASDVCNINFNQAGTDEPLQVTCRSTGFPNWIAFSIWRSRSGIARLRTRRPL